LKDAVEVFEKPLKPKKRKISPSARRELTAALLFISPWIVGLGGFLMYPIAASFYYSLCEYSVLQPAQFIGIGNYVDLFTDEVFWKALGNTFFYAALSLPLGLVLSVAIALLLNTGVRGMAVYRTIFFLPSLMPVVAMAILWLWIFNGDYGVLNYAVSSSTGWISAQVAGLGRFLNQHGIESVGRALQAAAPILRIEGPPWLIDPAWSKPAFVLLSLWGVGHAVVIYLAGLQDVPAHLYEAAELDGANWLQKVRYVTLPMISPVIQFNLILGIIGSFQFFAAPYVMAPNGQPARSAYFYTMMLYDNAFPYLRMGYACAIAWVLFVIVLVCTLVALRVSSRHVHYEGM
jgi:multiple sugar transport system permease protein